MPGRNKTASKKNKKAKVPHGKPRPVTPCTIPGPVDPAVLNAFAPQPNDETEAIRSYVEWQSPKEKVTYVEKVLTERIFDRKMDAYDVHTDGERYWVITEPTNLYSQRLYLALPCKRALSWWNTSIAHAGFQSRTRPLRVQFAA